MIELTSATANRAGSALAIVSTMHAGEKNRRIK
jgi:hypothetical protein